MSLDSNSKNEVETIADLEEQGFAQSERECRRCGTFMMYREMEWEHELLGEVLETAYECPHCGYHQVLYD